MLASLPKFPSTGNPISNPPRAIERRNYVLGRMLENRFIDQADLRRGDQVARPRLPARGAGRGRCAVFRRDGPHRSDGPPRQQRADRRLRRQDDARFGAAGSGEQRAAQRSPHLRPAPRLSRARSARRSRCRRRQERLGQGAARLPRARRPDAGRRDRRRRGGGDRLSRPRARPIALDLSAVEWARPHIDEDRRGATPKHVSDVLKRGDIVRVQLARQAAEKTEKNEKADKADKAERRPRRRTGCSRRCRPPKRRSSR